MSLRTPICWRQPGALGRDLRLVAGRCVAAPVAAGALHPPDRGRSMKTQHRDNGKRRSMTLTNEHAKALVNALVEAKAQMTGLCWFRLLTLHWSRSPTGGQFHTCARSSVWTEQWTSNPWAAGSNPAGRALCAGRASIDANSTPMPTTIDTSARLNACHHPRSSMSITLPPISRSMTFAAAPPTIRPAGKFQARQLLSTPRPRGR